jgi:F0F1-type ATP synthase membrane subunit b/b'
MGNNEVLDHLLVIESEAAALVDDAQAEANKRLMESEKQNRIAYEERYRKKSENLEAELQKTKDQAQQRYQKELEAYKEEISRVNLDSNSFSALLDTLIAGETQ